MRFILLSFGLAIALAAVPVRAQQAPERQPSPAEQRLEAFLERWNRMTPEERDQALAKMPPERARRIRLLLQRYNQMNPQEQQALRQRYRTFSELPPAEKQTVRQRLREFNQLPVERRLVVHKEVEAMRRLPDADRQTRLNSPEFKSRFSPPEQQIIRDLTEYLQPHQE